MDELKLLITDEDNWIYAEGENGGTVFQLRYRPQLQKFIATEKYLTRLTICWNYKSDNSVLLPNDDDMKLMEDVENCLVDIFEDDLQCILAFVYTGQNKKEWHWYSSDIAETGKRLNLALSEFDVLPLTLTSTHEPEWDEYNLVLADSDDSTIVEDDDES